MKAIIRSQLAHEFVHALESVLGRSCVSFRLEADGLKANLCGFIVRSRFVSFPILDVCVIDDLSKAEVEVRSTRYLIKDVRSEVESAALRLTGKSFFLINTSLSFEDYLDGVRPKYRSQIRNIKYAYRSQIRIGFHEEMVDCFYRLYALRIRTLGSLPLPKEFFVTLAGCEQLISGFIFDDGGRLRSTCLGLIVADTVHLLWAASDNRESSNLFMYRELIRFCCNDPDVNCINLGRASDDSSQYKFKERIGGKRIKQMVWSDDSSVTSTSRLPLFFRYFYRKIPIFILERLAKLFFRWFVK